MTDTFARQRQLIGTTAEWVTDNLVIGSGEFALETTVAGSVKMKIGNGTDLFSALPYVSGSGSTGGGGAGYLPLAGGALTGPLRFIGGTSVVRHNLEVGSAGDYYEFKVWSGNAGLHFVSRDAAGTHTMQWSRTGVLVLRNQDPAVDDYMGMSVKTIGGVNSFLFEHCDYEGNELTGGSYVFKTNAATSDSVTINTNGTVTATGTPWKPAHLITMDVADKRYAAIGSSGGASGSYLPLAGGRMAGVLQLGNALLYNVAGRASVRIETAASSAGDVFGIAVQYGKDAGMHFVTRDASNGMHWMRWTRNGVFSLSNKGSTGNMGMEVSTLNVAGYVLDTLVFEHTDANGNPDSNGGAFIFNGNPGQNVTLASGIAMQTGAPTSNNHLMTRVASDSRYARSSDRELKENITEYTADALAVLSKLKTVGFQYKEGTKSKLHQTHTDHFGFIAQDVVAVIPELVYEDEAKHLGLDYLELIPMLVKAVQQLNEKLEG